MSLRDMVWLTAERGRIYAVTALVCVAGVIGGEIWLLHGADAVGMVFGHDFGSFWAAARLAVAGHPASAYDPAALRAAEATIYAPGDYAPFLYPPTFLLLVYPFALLPITGALVCFTGLTGGAYALAIRRSPFMVCAALAFPAVLLNLIILQNGMLTAAILGGGLALMDRRPRAAGLILGLMVIKPQLALAVPLALLLTRRWRVLGWAAASAAVLIGLSVICFGAQSWAAFLANLPHARAVLEQGSLRSEYKFQSAFTMVALLSGSLRLAYAAQTAGALAAVGGLVWALRRGVSPGLERSLIVIASLLITPYVMSYDLVVLAFPMGWMLAEWSRDGFPPWSKLILLLVYLLPVMAFVPAAPPYLCWFGVAGLGLYLVRIRSPQKSANL